MLDIWAKILNKCEDSVFLLSAENNSIQSNNILKEFSKRNVSNEKIFFTVKLEYSDYLTRFSLCDLFLDTYPYGGHTTSFEALYANLPVLTLKGNVFQSRVTSSFLNNLGLKDLISNNPLEYIDLAQKIYQDKSYLKNLKNSLTENINKTDLFKNKKYTNDLEKIYIDIYNNNVN
jgi:protein O-GlcNAc transferase